MKRSRSVPKPPHTGGETRERAPNSTAEHEFRAAIRARSPDAWERLYCLYGQELMRQARLVLPGHLDPENAAAQVWLAGLKAARRYDPSWPPYPWLAAICLRVCLSVRRRQRILVRFLRLARPRVEVAESRGDAEAREALRCALSRLPRLQREIVALRFLFGVSVREIALLHGAQPNSVQQNLLRGLDRLRSSAVGGGLARWLSEPHGERIVR